jgi:DNA-binding CsgD family transcriptional regulator
MPGVINRIVSGAEQSAHGGITRQWDARRVERRSTSKLARSRATVGCVHGSLFGREDERRAIDEVLGAAHDGLSGALVLRGDAGMGKTTLLDYAIESAGDVRVVRVSGVESESEFGYGALHRLLQPFLGSLDALPPLQRDALGCAFGLVVGSAPDRFIVGLAALSLLADAAAPQPLLCAVDDAQWLDKESLDALAFIGRRLHADRIALLFAVRASATVHAPFDGLTTVEVGPLTDESAHELLAAVVEGSVDGRVAETILEETRGCPLAVVELASSLSTEQLVGGALLPEPLPIGSRLEGHFLRQVSALPQDTQMLLLIAAAEPCGDAVLLWRAADCFGIASAAADAALEQGLLLISTRVEFRHPLIRSAVYGGADASTRRDIHRSLAAVTDREPEQRAWHLAAAAVGPDEDVAKELERCAVDARNRGRYAAEAAFLSRAAELTPNRDDRAVRLLSAAQSHVIAGAPHVAETLLAQARPRPTCQILQAQAQRLDAALHAFSLPNEVPLALLSAARALETLDVRLARETYAEALEACLVASQLAKGTNVVEVGRAALAAPASADAAPTTADLLLEGFATRFAVGYGEAVPVLRRAVAALAESDVGSFGFSRSGTLGASAAAELWDAEGYGALLRRLEPVERARGALDSLRITLGCLGHYEMWAGRFNVAESYHSEASELARALGAHPAVWDLLKVELFAWQGRDAETRTAVDLLTGPLAQAAGAGVAVNLARYALTILELAQGHYENAFRSAWPLYEQDFPPQGTQALAEIVEAGVRAGHRCEAAAAFDRLAERASASGTPWALGLLARSQALVAGDGDAESRFRESIARLATTTVRTDLARAHLLYGEWLRRQRRRQAARTELRAAHEMFTAMGAQAFAERARLELAATGERARQRSVDTLSELTPQESQVARLASDGATNRDIAAAMFISATTVEYHLSKVYRKLGIRSRGYLRAALAS